MNEKTIKNLTELNRTLIKVNAELRCDKEALQTLCTELAKVLQDWEKMSLTDGWAYKRRDVLDKYQEITGKGV